MDTPGFTDGFSGRTRDTYAVFSGVTGRDDAFAITWQSGLSIAGALSGIVL